MTAPSGAVMLVLKWGPWSVAAVLLAAGVAAGLLLPGPASGPAGAGLLLLVAGALPALLHLGSLWRGRARGSSRSGPPGPVALAATAAAILWTGLAVGSDGRARSLGHCEASLHSGDSVRAEGRVTGRSGPGVRPGRIRLEDVRLEAARGECTTGMLLVLSDVPLEAGSVDRVVADGRWWRYPGSAGRPRSEGRRGLLRADGSPEALPAGGGVGRSGDAGTGFGTGLVRRLRHGVRSRLSAGLADDVAPLGAALLLADRDGLSSSLRERFADAGLAHLLAVSGLHVGVVGGLILGLAGLLTRDRRRYPWSAALTMAYVAWIGAPPSALRAGLLYAGWAWCRFRGAPVPVLEFLAAAGIASLLWDPLVLLDVGFQLSFTGFFGLLVGLRLSVAFRSDAGQEAPPARGAPAVVAASAGAFLATAPLVAIHFHRVAPVALVSGLAASPVVAAAVPALAAAVVLPEPAAVLAADAATGLLRALVWLSECFTAIPGAGRPVAPPGPAGVAAAVLLGVGVVRLAAAGRWSRGVVPAASAAGILLAWPGLAGGLIGGGARICALDVGQGDALAVRTDARNWMLIDAGSGPPGRDAGLESVVPHLRRWGVRRVDVLVVTHPHLDHVGGAASLARSLPIGEIWDAGTVVGSPAYLALLEEAASRGIRWRSVGAGDRFRLDGIAGLVLGPGRGSDFRDPNESSVVLHLSFPSGVTALLAGDAGPLEEAWILDRWAEERLRARILKVSHHGSRSSTGRRWLEAVRPRVAIVSAGEGNRYGHPHPRVLARMDEFGVSRVRRTDREGTVCIAPD